MDGHCNYNMPSFWDKKINKEYLRNEKEVIQTPV